MVILVNVLEEPIIKRVVATEGQTVDFDEDMGELVVDGQPLAGEAYHIANGITYVPDRPGEVLEFPQTVPEGCVFVLGDNRQNSKDSRFAEVGMVDCRNILGKVVFNSLSLLANWDLWGEPMSEVQSVQWFPGHMAKTRRKITEDLKLVDIAAELLDAPRPQEQRQPGAAADRAAEAPGGAPQ